MRKLLLMSHFYLLGSIDNHKIPLQKRPKHAQTLRKTVLERLELNNYG